MTPLIEAWVTTISTTFVVLLFSPWSALVLAAFVAGRQTTKAKTLRETIGGIVIAGCVWAAVVAVQVIAGGQPA